MGKIRYFFCYARKDTESALKLAKELRAAGVNLWLDQLDILGGQRWDRAVEEALRTCGGMIAMLSPEALASENVMDEVSYALEEGKLIVPVLFRTCEIPFRLRRLQHVDFTTDHDAGFSTLLRALQVDRTSAVTKPSEPDGQVTREPEEPGDSTPHLRREHAVAVGTTDIHPLEPSLDEIAHDRILMDLFRKRDKFFYGRVGSEQVVVSDGALLEIRREFPEQFLQLAKQLKTVAEVSFDSVKQRFDEATQKIATQNRVVSIENKKDSGKSLLKSTTAQCLVDTSYLEYLRARYKGCELFVSAAESPIPITLDGALVCILMPMRWHDDLT